MRNTHRLIFCIAGVTFLISIPLINATEILISVPNFASTSRAAVSVENVVGVIDQAVTMLMTINLSLFVIVGFIIKSFGRGADLFGTGFFPLLLLVFLFSAAISINMGYMARSEVITLVSNGQSGFSHVQSIIALQAFFLYLSFASSVILGMILILKPKPCREPVAD